MAGRKNHGLLLLALAALAVAGAVFWLLDDGGQGAGELVGDSLDEQRDDEGPQLSAEGRPASERAGAEAGEPDAGEASAEAAAAPLAQSGKIVGVVTDASGAPIPGVRIQFVEPLKKDGKESERRHVATTVTGANGQFFQEVGLEGFYTLRYLKPGYMLQASNGIQGGGPIRIRLAKAVRLSGVLREKESGRPIAKFTFYAKSTRASETGGARHVATTDVDGRFSFDVPEGEPHFLCYPYSTFVTWGQSGDWLHTRWGPYEGEQSDLELELGKGLRIAGRVVAASGAKLSGTYQVEVLGRTASGDPDYGRRRFVNTEQDGSFVVRGLPEGRYLVGVEATVTTNDGASRDAATGLSSRRLDGIAAGTEDLVIELSAGTPMRGVLVDEDGEPVTAQGYVFVYPQGSMAGNPDSVYGKVDGKGGFETPPLDPGTTYDVMANGFEGFRQANVDGVRTGEAAVRVVLVRAGTIKGKVVAEDGSQVPPGTGVMATAVGAPAGADGVYGYTYTGVGGSFTLNGLGPYPFSIAAGGAGSGLVGKGSVVGVEVGKSDVVVKVRKGVPLSGKLLDKHGDGVKTHMLTAVSLDNRTTPSAWTAIQADDGVFHFAGVTKGKLRIMARVGDRTVPVGEVTAPAEDVVLTLPEE